MVKFFGAGVGARNETDDTLVPVGRKHNSQPRVAVHQGLRGTRAVGGSRSRQARRGSMDPHPKTRP